MKLKGGIIIIGSLFWEDHLDNEKTDNIRKNWRQQYLNDSPKLTKVPIRYGRASQTRKDRSRHQDLSGSHKGLPGAK